MPGPGIEKLKQTIRDVGLRATPARVATLDLLHRVALPLTHADVAEHLAEIDKATAFRNLNDMADAGLIRRTELGDRLWRFELIGEFEHKQVVHSRFVCVDCGSVSYLNGSESIEESFAASKQIGEVTEILLRGHCKHCN